MGEDILPNERRSFDEKPIMEAKSIDAVEIWDRGRFEQRQKSDIETLNGGELLKASTGYSGASGPA